MMLHRNADKEKCDSGKENLKEYQSCPSSSDLNLAQFSEENLHQAKQTYVSWNI